MNGRRIEPLIDTPLQGDLRLSGPQSGQGAGGGARTHDRRVSVEPRVDSPATVPLAIPYQTCEVPSFPQQDDLELLGPQSGRGADGVARTCDRSVPADVRADSQATMPPTPS
ncbi:hypothetical protein PoB_004461800 [Plakobranchus ocellatus]|uniref:Uncharacterized protein n=1 Tax=Plakobranchus ocellatus TaxID=259542 RepID=A0AAV4BET8_9GAST|nr:hypothetical protein PoB_004461800 [Plakobranchus ocellatus]